MSRFVQGYAREALKELISTFSSSNDPLVAVTLQRLLEDPDKNIQTQARDALKRLEEAKAKEETKAK